MANTHKHSNVEILTPSSSLKGRNKKSRSLFHFGSDADDLIALLHGSDPIRIELNRLENELKDKDRELGDAQAKIKALKFSDRLKEKAVDELSNELEKLEEKLKAAEANLEGKNLEIKKVNDEKKAAVAAQFAAEATLRRVHASQKYSEMTPIESLMAPIEAELKLAKLEIAKLQEDNKALDRLTKAKEAALLEAEKSVQVAMEKASLVVDLQNKNQELQKQIEICQEENRMLDKMHKQKVAEIEKLTQTVCELEEAILAGGAAANAVREYQQKVQEMNEERKMMDRELARAKVTANRVATVVANEWKDENSKVMPVKQWLEERRFLKGEMQQLHDKLAVAERTAKAEMQLKEKYKLRFKILEERLKPSPNIISHTTPDGISIKNGFSRRQSLGGAANFSTPCSKRASALFKHAKVTPKSFDGDDTILEEDNTLINETKKENIRNEDFVSGILYDMLQKEVISLRKACHEKDQSLKDKDDAIENLGKKVETLNKAMEVESKKMRKVVATVEKEIAAMRVSKEHEHRAQRFSAPRAAINVSHQSQSARNART